MRNKSTELKMSVSSLASFDLVQKVEESLTAGKQTSPLYPIATLEGVQYEEELQDVLHDYLLYGSYHNIIKSSSCAETKEELIKLSNSYLYQDILGVSDSKDRGKIKELLILLAKQLGQEVSLKKLANCMKIHTVTVQRYLNLLEQSFVIFKLRAFSRNLYQEISKPTKYYFYDVGIRNAILNNFRPLNLRTDTRILWKNFLICEKMKQNEYNRKLVNQYFWRTYDYQAIDYIEEEDGYLRAYDFKWQATFTVRKPKLFLNTYEDSNFRVISQKNYLTEFLKI
jgi:predicted AAA+ superfamily ATPase